MIALFHAKTFFISCTKVYKCVHLAGFSVTGVETRREIFDLRRLLDLAVNLGRFDCQSPAGNNYWIPYTHGAPDRVESNLNQIVFTISQLIWNRMEFRLVPNQTGNGKYNLIPVNLTRT